MKKLILSIIAVTIVFVSISGFTKNHKNSKKIEPTNTVVQNSNKSMDFTLNLIQWKLWKNLIYLK